MIVGLGHDGHPVPRRLDAAGPERSGQLACSAGLLHIAIFGAKMGVFMITFIWVRWMLPALPVRPAHGPGLAAVHPAGAGEHPGHRPRGRVHEQIGIP
jgi:hypothetical protein